MTATKHCKRCDKRKPLSDFYVNFKSGGVSVYCKPCQSAYNQATKDKTKSTAYNSKWRKKKLAEGINISQRNYHNHLTNLGPARLKAERFLCNLYRKDRKSIDAGVSVDLLEKMFTETTLCKCCGKQLRVTPPDVKGKKHHDAASIDRINNDIHYTASNIAVICLECNTKKRNLTIEDMKMFISYIERLTYV